MTRRVAYLLERLSRVDSGGEQEFKPYAYKCIGRAIERDGETERILAAGLDPRETVAALRALYANGHAPRSLRIELLDRADAAERAAANKAERTPLRAAYVTASAILRAAAALADSID